jgi:hypothetical protein
MSYGTTFRGTINSTHSQWETPDWYSVVCTKEHLHAAPPLYQWLGL